MLSSNSLAYLSQGMLLLHYNDHFGSPCLWGGGELLKEGHLYYSFISKWLEQVLASQ